ncbi:MAG: DUF4301 family protein, partial [Deltaproteobacteria bacterium]|nr:DUF4301 family protein [Deltaproteobacteria bacterium]
MSLPTFSNEDLRQISEQGLTPERVREQLERFARGMNYARLDKPCRVGDGIRRFPPEELKRYAAIGEPAVAAGRAMKFVPASGAGSRMFQSFLRCLHESVETQSVEALRDLVRYPFFEALRDRMAASGLSLEECLRRGECADVLEFLLTPRGLNYAAYPKGLIPFHAYPDGARTALEEQIVEGVFYLRDAAGACRFHFTVSSEHEALIRDFLKSVLSRYENAGTRIELSFS